MHDEPTSGVFERLLSTEMEHGSLYAFAETYDVDYAGYRAELAFYRRVIARGRESDEAYVEIGAGTGRLLIPYASAGLRCHGVEPARSMRERLVEKLARETLPPGRVTVENGHAHDFVGPTDARVGVVAFPFNGIQHLFGHDMLHAFLARARDVLVDEGCVAFDVTGPAWEEMAAGVREWGRLDERVHQTTGERIYTIDRSVFDDERRVMRTSFRYLAEHATKGVEAFIEQYMWTAQELLHAVTQAGFTVDMAFGDVDFAPLDERSPRLLVAARKRR
jgi:cyclopropane fatty-acyl-phospholipid synthase-like methyltransferase